MKGKSLYDFPIHLGIGAKAIAEIPIDAMAPAVANAVADALGIRIRQIPLTPERVLRAIREQGLSR